MHILVCLFVSITVDLTFGQHRLHSILARYHRPARLSGTFVQRRLHDTIRQDGTHVTRRPDAPRPGRPQGQRLSRHDTTFSCNVVRPAVSVERDDVKVEPDYPVFDASEPHGLLQEHGSSFVDLVADSYGADGGTDVDQLDSFLSYHDSPNNYVATNPTTTGGQEDLFSASHYDLNDTFLTHGLSLSAASGDLSDFSAIFCDGS